MAMNDVFFDKYQSGDSQAIVYADSNERRSMWMRFLGFECDSYRQACNTSPQMRAVLVNVSRWDCRFERITMKKILKHLGLPTM
jgi:hypothetical protein